MAGLFEQFFNVLVLRLFMSNVVVRSHFPKVARVVFHVLWIIGSENCFLNLEV